MQFGILDLLEANKLLLAIAELADKSGAATSQSVRHLCSSTVFGGQKHNHARLVELCATLGLIARSRDRLSLTSYGKIFLSHNSECFYELTPAQKEFFINHFIFEGKLQVHANFLFRLFVEDSKRGTLVLDTIDSPPPLSLNWFVNLILSLGILQREQSLLLVCSPYIFHVRRLNAPKTEISPRELEAILSAKRKLGELGEVLAMDFERKRLLSLGRIAEADLVSQVSRIDTTAGFDIKSFDGDKPMYDYNRFIEVKASTDLNIRFIWSRNEFETAKVLAEDYWIYFLAGLNPKEPDHFRLMMIQNPAQRLEELGLALQPVEYLVQCGDFFADGKNVMFGENLSAIIL